MIPIEFKIKVNGRRFGLDRGAAELEKAAITEASKKLQATVRHILCPTHGRSARIEVTKGRNGKLASKITACCDELRERVTSALN